VAQDNVETVRRFMAQINAQEFDAALALLTPDAQLDWSGSDAPDRGVFHGRDGWAEWMAGRAADLSETHFDVRELLDAPPDMVVLVARSRGRGRASGAVIEALGAVVCALRDGRIARLTLYASREQALKAARLAE
jgi:ketosteroid isomerase-like protein